MLQTEVLERLLKAKNIVISTHKSPDGDAIGSSIAFYHYLKQLGKDSTIVLPNEYADNMKWLIGDAKVYLENHEADEVQSAIKKADYIIILDYNGLNRAGEIGLFIEKNKTAFKIMLDHHPQPDENCVDWLVSKTDIGSTCEIVYDFIVDNNHQDKITREIAEAIYTGIMTDTGSFRFPSTTAKTHRVIADLMDKGAVHFKIHQNVYDDNSLSRLKLLGYALNDKLEVYKEFNAGLISYSAEELKHFKYSKGDTDGFVNYILSLKGMRLAIFLSEKDGVVKMSFRSKGDFSVNDFARKHFNGGGHKNAAGGVSELSLEETIKKVKNLLPEYESELAG